MNGELMKMELNGNINDKNYLVLNLFKFYSY